MIVFSGGYHGPTTFDVSLSLDRSLVFWGSPHSYTH